MNQIGPVIEVPSSRSRSRWVAGSVFSCLAILFGWSVIGPPVENARAMVGGCVAIIVLIRLLSPRLKDWPWVLSGPLVVLGSLEAILGALQAGARPDVAGTFGAPDVLAAFAALCFPFSLLHGLWVLRNNPNRHKAPAWPAVCACLLFTGAATMLVTALSFWRQTTLSWPGLFHGLPVKSGNALIASAACAILVRAWILSRKAIGGLERSSGKYLGWACLMSITSVLVMIAGGYTIQAAYLAWPAAWIVGIAEGLRFIDTSGVVIMPQPFAGRRTRPGVRTLT